MIKTGVDTYKWRCGDYLRLPKRPRLGLLGAGAAGTSSLVSLAGELVKPARFLSTMGDGWCDLYEIQSGRYKASSLFKQIEIFKLFIIRMNENKFQFGYYITKSPCINRRTKWKRKVRKTRRSQKERKLYSYTILRMSWWWIVADLKCWIWIVNTIISYWVGEFWKISCWVHTVVIRFGRLYGSFGCCWLWVWVTVTFSWN